MTALKRDGDVAAIVGDRVYPEPPADPVWPFIRYGFPIVERLQADGWSGGTHAITIHVFANGPGNDAALKLAKAVVAALDEQDIRMEGAGGTALVQWSNNVVLRDSAEASAYHVAVQFDVATLEIVE